MSVKIGGKELKPQAQKVEPAKTATAPAKAAKPVKAKKRRYVTRRAYPAKVFERLFQYIADGEDLSGACRNHQGMPTPSTVRRRLAVDDQLADQFKQANQIRLHGVADQLIRLPDEALEGVQKVSAADRIAAAKLKSDNIKWVASRMLSEYAGAEGEGQAVTLHIHGAPDAAPSAGTTPTPYTPAGTPVLKIVGGAAKPAEGSDSGESGNG